MSALRITSRTGPTRLALLRPLLPAISTLVLLHGLCPATARAQQDLNGLVVQWAKGSYASPVICTMKRTETTESKSLRGIRRVELDRKLRHGRDLVATLEFVDMEVDDATRCFDATAHAISNLVGKLELRVPGASHPETARSDFRSLLKRKKGFEFEVIAGKLRAQEVTDPPSTFRPVNVSRATVSLTAISPGMDAARELAEFSSPRKTMLELKLRGGEVWRIPLFQTFSRPR